MEENSSDQDLKCPAHYLVSDASEVPKRLYFINEIVEWNLTKYIWTGCTDVGLRDAIMSNASELIRQIIRKQGLHMIYPGQEDSSMGDLVNTAWCQVEKVLYKYKARPHCRKCYSPDRPSDSILYSPKQLEYGILTLEETVKKVKKCKICDSVFSSAPIIEPKQGLFGGSTTILYKGTSKVFNMWSQVARTVILAYIKKEGRDRKNSDAYMNHVGTKNKSQNDVIARFISEAKNVCEFNDEHLILIEALSDLIRTDDKPHDGLVGKLIEKTNLSRFVVTGFFKLLKLRSSEFTDSPVNKGSSNNQMERKKIIMDEEDES